MIIAENTKTNLEQIAYRSLRLFKPREFAPVSDWAAKHRFVSREESARPGMWDNELVPFAVEPMNCFNNETIERITFMGSAQVIKTEIIKNIIGYNADQLGDPMLLIYPSEDDARDFSTEKLDPMIRNNPSVSAKIASERAHSKENKTLFKKFLEGGFLAISGSNAPQKLARRSVKYVLVDDRDRVGAAGVEGDAVSLAWERTESYALLGRQLWEFSTPTVEGMSGIQAAYRLSDQREYYVPCPFCEKHQTLKFEQLKWHKDVDAFGNATKHYPESVYYECEHCGKNIDERYKNTMITQGEWIAKHPERTNHRGYWINRLYTPFSTWEMIVKKFLETKTDKLKFRVFLNTYLAKTFEIKETIEIDEDGLLTLVEDYLTEKNPHVPTGVLVATGSVDVQSDRLEAHIVGWGYGEESWALNHTKLYGDPSQRDVWNDLNDYIKENLNVKRKDGLEIPVKLFFVDSGGHHTQQVYNYCTNRMRVIAVKGQAGWNKPILLNATKVGKNRSTILQNIGVDGAKSVIHHRLRRQINKRLKEGPGVMHFSKAFCDIEYFMQLTAEKVEKDYNKRNEIVPIWKKKSTGSRNEILDLWVYAYAALLALKPDWEALQKNREKQLENLHSEDKEKKKKQKIVTIRKRSSFVDGWK